VKSWESVEKKKEEEFIKSTRASKKEQLSIRATFAPSGAEKKGRKRRKGNINSAIREIITPRPR